MADEKNHMGNFDGPDIVISGGVVKSNTSDKDIPRIQSKIIYESSDKIDGNSGYFYGYEDVKNDYSAYDRDIDEEFLKDFYSENDEIGRKKHKKKKSAKVIVEDPDPFARESQMARLVKETGDYIIRTSYKKPNTFKATLVGILIGVMILVLGFTKTLVLALIVFVANIVGQLLDENPRMWSVVDFIVRRFR